MPSAADIGFSSACPPIADEPSSMRNPVALEVQVIATGARPSEDSSTRELFTEPTSTVLVFENGAVIRLTAGVATGQLLFLTHQESKREVVAQVMRKRSFRPTSCYVELEFTEPAPGFWGIEFPTADEPSTTDPRQTGILELVQEAEVTSELSNETANPPSHDEVDQLKREVEGLREQLQALLQSQSQPGIANQPAAHPKLSTVLAPAHADAFSPISPPEPVRAVRMQLPTADPTYVAAPPAPNPNLAKPASLCDSDGNFSEESVLRSPSSEAAQPESSIWTPARVAQERKARGRTKTLLIGLASGVLVLGSTGLAFYLVFPFHQLAFDNG